MTLKIYGIARSPATRNLWLADELGIPFEHVEIELGPAGTQSETFKKINPNRQIPVIDDDGFRMWESLAINLYLAKKQGGSMAPRDLHEDGLMTMWSLWAATAVENHALAVFYNTAGYEPKDRDPAAVTSGVAALQAPLAVLDQSLAGGHLVGSRYTVADLNVASVVFYLRVAPDVVGAYRNIKTWYDIITVRPAFRAAMKRRGE